MNLLSTRIFKALAVSAVALVTTGAQASNSWNSLELIDMTTSSDVGGDFVVTTGFLHDMDLVAFAEPSLSVAQDAFSLELNDDSEKTGWAGVVEVDMTDDATLAMDDISAFSDTFDTTDRETKVSGFYTMRYEFATDLPFRPYAGAGLGVVATSNDAESSGIIAGRATAGFDLTVGKDSAIFAEYAFVKSGGVNLGASGNSGTGISAIPDSEHSLKLGFRRTF